MVRVIMGAKGTGKTKQLIDMINHAADNEGGSVVCVEIGKKLVYDVSPKVRLVESSDFAADNFTFLKGLYQRHVCLQLRFNPRVHRQPVQNHPLRARLP